MNYSQHYKTIHELNAAAKAIRSPALTSDIYKAIKKTLLYYIKRKLVNRFSGRKYNPDYPRLNPEYVKKKFAEFGPKPILVRTGLMKSIVLKTSKLRGDKRTMTISSKGPHYSKYLKKRGFDFLSPKLPKEKRDMRKYFYRELSKLRLKRKNRI